MKYLGLHRPFKIEPEAVEDLEVITGTFTEYGRAMSGVVNAITKMVQINLKDLSHLDFPNMSLETLISLWVLISLFSIETKITNFLSGPF